MFLYNTHSPLTNHQGDRYFICEVYETLNHLEFPVTFHWVQGCSQDLIPMGKILLITGRIFGSKSRERVNLKSLSCKNQKKSSPQAVIFLLLLLTSLGWVGIFSVTAHLHSHIVPHDGEGCHVKSDSCSLLELLFIHLWRLCKISTVVMILSITYK